MGTLKRLFKKSTEPARLEDEHEWFLPPKYERPVRDVRIKMKAACRGSNDGIHVLAFAEGEEYTVSASLADAFVEGGLAERI
jgi:hypothetical protein